jgi:hypothetical protein
LIAIAVFVFWGGIAKAKNSLLKQADPLAWKSSLLLTTSTVDILEQQCWLGVNAIQGSYLGASLNPVGSFNLSGAETKQLDISCLLYSR